MSNQLTTECKTYLKNKGAEYKAGQWRIPHEEFECHDYKLGRGIGSNCTSAVAALYFEKEDISAKKIFDNAGIIPVEDLAGGYFFEDRREWEGRAAEGDSAAIDLIKNWDC